MRVTILGCGPSTGVPVIGGNWGRCDPNDPRNRRRRVSVLVEVGGAVILVDTSRIFGSSSSMRESPGSTQWC